MSVIVYDATAKIMYADTRAYSGEPHPIGNKMKIHRLRDGSLLGMSSGQPGVPEAFMDWIERDERLDDWAPSDIDLEALLVNLSGEVFLYSDRYTASGPLVSDVFTIGSGKKYALGALRAGATPHEAVEIAISCDPMCGGPVAAKPLYERVQEAAAPVLEPIDA